MKKSELKALILECKQELAEESQNFTPEQINDQILTEKLSELTNDYTDALIKEVYPDYELDFGDLSDEIYSFVTEFVNRGRN